MTISITTTSMYRQYGTNVVFHLWGLRMCSDLFYWRNTERLGYSPGQCKDGMCFLDSRSPGKEK